MSPTLSPAPLGRRLLAWLVDALIAALPLCLILVPLFVGLVSMMLVRPAPLWLRNAGEGAAMLWGLCTLMSLGWLLVYSLMRDALGGASLGKRLCGLRVVSIETGAVSDLKAAVMRNVPGAGAILAFFFVPLLGQLAPLVEPVALLANSQRQRLGDRWAGTLVVRS